MPLTSPICGTTRRRLRRRRAEQAHTGEHERETGRPDLDRPTWYAEYLEREQSGGSPEYVSRSVSRDVVEPGRAP